RIPQFDLAELRGLSDRLAGYQGTLRADAVLTGSLRHPRGTAQASVPNARFGPIAFGPVTLAARFDDPMLHAELALTQVGAGRLDVTATYQRISNTIDAELHARHVQLAFARAFIKQMRDLGGVLDADVRVGGTTAMPTLAGRVAVTQGVMGVVGQPTFRDVELELALSPGHVDIRKVHAMSNGSFDATGSADLRGLRLLQLPLTAQAKGVVAAGRGTTGRLHGR